MSSANPMPFTAWRDGRLDAPARDRLDEHEQEASAVERGDRDDIDEREVYGNERGDSEERREAAFAAVPTAPAMPTGPDTCDRSAWQRTCRRRIARARRQSLASPPT